MAEELMQPHPLSDKRAHQDGFVLITVIIILSLLSLLSIGQVYRSRTNQQESASSVMKTQATYYAETAISYIQWAWANDADFDASLVASDNTTIGDRAEWLTAITNPGPTTIGGSNGTIRYWDNSPMTSRAVRWGSSTCTPPQPIMHNIAANLSTFITLNIDQYGTISPLNNQSVPTNGAIIWLTAGTPSTDYEITSVATCTLTSPDQGCFKIGKDGCGNPINANNTLYHVVAYAIGYVNSKPLYLLRSIIY
ncbi:MAG: hypothetical protein Q9M26_08740 [Mariprofundales bacterium]|nr:hypothetical protein [Mariprofundales bacterium]